jgi:phospholipid/cholesterol/gamma-HCH transport system substrate-binding protein
MSREFWFGIFAVSTLSILAAGIFLIGRRQSLFSATYPLKAAFDNVSGLNPGAPVRVAGIYQGTVRQIDLPRTTTEKVSVIMDLEDRTRSLIRKDSVAFIKAEGLLGDKFIEISIGSEKEPALREGATVPGAAPWEISDLFGKANRILDTTTAVVENAEKITTHLTAVSSKIDQGKGTIGALVNDRTLYSQAAAGTTSFRENMQALKQNFFLRGFFRDRGYENSADLDEHAIRSLPRTPHLQRFVFDPERLFDKEDSAKLKKTKDLDPAGRFLESNRFGLAVVVASKGMKGDGDEAEVLTQARAMVVREYLVDHFALDDTRVKTLGLGKKENVPVEGKLELVVYRDPRR